jgi:SAM-dependent methyltransferase
MDVFGAALLDQFNNNAVNTLWLHNNYGEPEEMPTDVFFRNADELPDLEELALKLCKGKVLDIGAGAGSHALILQQHKVDVTALEISLTACEIMRKRGVLKVVNCDVFDYEGSKYDTLLLLMNGIGLAESLDVLPSLLKKLKTLLNPGGQILFDSSDVSYLYQDIDLPEDTYFGEITYQYEYKGIKGAEFGWLYVDAETMQDIAEANGFSFSLLHDDGEDQYLAQLQLLEI